MAQCKYVGVISVQREYRDGAWILTSENLPGLFLAGDDLKAIRADIPAAIKLLYSLNYAMDVNVCVAGEPENATKKQPTSGSERWAAIPSAA